MKLTVLGKSPAWQDAGGACSGYLVEEDGFRLLVDCGNGVFGRLREHVDYVDLDAVVVSHMHADHTLDLVPYAYALLYAPRQQPVPVPPWPGTDAPARPHLHVPPGGRAGFAQVTTAWGAPDLLERAFRMREYEPDHVLELGPLRLRFHPVPHYVPTWAIEITAPDGARLVYGADSSPSEELVTFARGADLVLLEATLPRPEREGPRGHLTAEEAADHARRAGAGRLVLTHVSDEQEPADVLARARGRAGDRLPVELAAADAVYAISPRADARRVQDEARGVPGTR